MHALIVPGLFFLRTEAFGFRKFERNLERNSTSFATFQSVSVYTELSRRFYVIQIRQKLKLGRSANFFN